MIRLLAVAALAVAVFTSPAAADEAMACVQTELAARGLDPGAQDGNIGPQTQTAAAAFAAGTDFPMPQLAAATAAEWCAILRGWDRRLGGPFTGTPAQLAEIATFRNDDPAALPLGIRFNASVPDATRELVLQDLDWVRGLGTLDGTEALATYLGWSGPITGADLVGWFVERISGITLEEDALCPTREMLFFGQKDGGLVGRDYVRCILASEGAVASSEGNRLRPPDWLARAVYFDGFLMSYSTLTTTSPVLYLGETFVHSDWVPDWLEPGEMAYRFDRLGTLYHEAFHSTDPTDEGHDPCGTQNMFAAATDIGFFFQEQPGDDAGCDDDRGAHAFEALVKEVLVRNCGCTVRDQLNGYYQVLSSWTFVLLPVEAWTVPDLPALSETGLIGRTIDQMPPLRFFELMVEAHDLYLTLVPRDTAFAAEARALFGLAADKAPDLSAVAPPPGLVTPAPDALWPGIWLDRALRATDTDHNVPLAWLKPCTTTSLGCDADWLAAIQPLENGVATSFTRGSGLGEWAAINIGEGGGRDFRLAMSGSTVAADLTMDTFYYWGDPAEEVAPTGQPPTDLEYDRIGAGLYYVRITGDGAAAGTGTFSLTASWIQNPPPDLKLLPDPTQAPTYGEAVMAGGEAQTIPLAAGGEVDAYNAARGECVGFIAVAPNYLVRMQPTADSLPLIVAARSDGDTTLVILDPSGRWHCNDDTVGLNPLVHLGPPIKGVYYIWVGTYDYMETADATLLLSACRTCLESTLK